MKKISKILKIFLFLFAFLSFIGFLISFNILESLRPKMIRFLPITHTEENLLNYFGFTLLFFLIFCLFSFYHLVKYLKNAPKISFWPLSFLFLNVLAFIFIFGDLALINDIGKQYKHGLSQPEWLILYPVMACQTFSILILCWAHFFQFKGVV